MKNKKAIDTLEKLAQMMSDGFDDVHIEMETHFSSLESEVRNGFDEIKRKLDVFDTRISALEYKVFGSSERMKVAK